MFDVSDEATGLPPLTDVDPSSSIFALQWLVGIEGVVDHGEAMPPTAVKYLSFRGIQVQEDGTPEYAQIHVAVPHDAIRIMCEQTLDVLNAEEARMNNPPSASPE